MAGIGNLADWSDAGGALPCDIMDSFDDMGAPASLDAPLSNGLLRAPSITSDGAAGDLDYLYQMGGARWGDWGASVDESSIPLSPPASLPVRPAVTSPSSASTSAMESESVEQPHSHEGAKAAKAAITAAQTQDGDTNTAETVGGKEGKDNRRAPQAGKSVPPHVAAASASSSTNSSANPLTVTGPRSTRGLRGAAAAAARGGVTLPANSGAGEDSPSESARSSARSSRARSGGGQAPAKAGGAGPKDCEFGVVGLGDELACRLHARGALILCCRGVEGRHRFGCTDRNTGGERDKGHRPSHCYRRWHRHADIDRSIDSEGDSVRAGARAREVDSRVDTRTPPHVSLPSPSSLSPPSRPPSLSHRSLPTRLIARRQEKEPGKQADRAAQWQRRRRRRRRRQQEA